MQGLHRLDLSNNKIQKLVVRLFYGLRKLKHLDLSGNPVGELKPEIFQDLEVRHYYSIKTDTKNTNTHILYVQINRKTQTSCVLKRTKHENEFSNGLQIEIYTSQLRLANEFIFVKLFECEMFFLSVGWLVGRIFFWFDSTK